MLSMYKFQFPLYLISSIYVAFICANIDQNTLIGLLFSEITYQIAT